MQASAHERYRLLEELGRGGMGVVYRARDLELDRELALKALPPELTTSLARMGRLRKEARSLAALTHPGIVTIYDIQEIDGRLFLAMELVHGEELGSLIPTEGMDVGSFLSLAILLSDAVSAAHQQGLVHRDLKPGNIMVTADGRIKVLDFGLATVRKDAEEDFDQDLPTLSRPAIGSGPGTPAYMAPEQIRGGKTDCRTDVFALGVILYQMASGRHPFCRDLKSCVDVFSAILRDEPPMLTEIRPDLPPALDQILRSCLAKDPEHRPQSAKDVCNQLEMLREELTVLAHTPREGADLKSRQPPRNRWLIVALVVTGFFVASVVAFQLLREQSASRVLLGSNPVQASSIGMAPAPDQRSIAVLPFSNVGGRRDQEYFSDGITEEILLSLAQIPRLKVAARTSSFSFKDKNIPVQEIGRQLNVATVLEGSVRRSGNRLRINAQLVSTKDGYQIWGEVYDRELDEIFAIEEEIAKSIVEALKVELPGDSTSVMRRATTDTEAHSLYLKGRALWHRRTNTALMESREYFQAAVDRDPEYALAYAGLGDAYAMIGAYSGLPPSAAFPQASVFALRALEIDSRLAEPHATLLAVKLDYHFDWPGAEEEFHRAMELNPNYTMAHLWYALYLTSMGRLKEAGDAIRVTREIDPLSLVVNAHVGAVHYYGRDYARAEAELKAAQSLDPTFVIAHWYLGLTNEQLGKFDDAIAEQQKAVAYSNGDPKYLAALARAYALAGRRTEAEAILAQLRELSKQRYVSALDFAFIYAGLNETARALDWLEDAYHERSWGLYRIKVEPRLDNLRNEPRFRSIVERMQIPDRSTADLR